MNDQSNPYTPPPLFYTQSSTLAIVSLIAGILGWVGFIGIGAVVAIITGHLAKNEIRKSSGHLTGTGMANAGLVLGYLNLALCIIGLCIVALLFIIGVTHAFTH